MERIEEKNVVILGLMSKVQGLLLTEFTFRFSFRKNQFYSY